MKAPSEEFYQAFKFIGTCRTTCDCGITHYTSRGGFDFDEGELEELQRRSEQDPEKYRDWDDITVEYVNFGDRTFVFKCDCNRLRPYEDFLWQWRNAVTDYYSNRAAGQLERAFDSAKIATRSECAVDIARGL